MVADERPRGGPALKQAIHIARARASISSDMQLALRAGVHYDTLMNWYAERTAPRGHELSKVAAVLDVPLADLLAAWEGRAPDPPELHESIRELVAELRELVASQDAATAALMGALGELARKGDDPVSVPSTSTTGNGDGAADVRAARHK
jgi:hypothetical protein